MIRRIKTDKNTIIYEVSLVIDDAVKQYRAPAAHNLLQSGRTAGAENGDRVGTAGRQGYG